MGGDDKGDSYMCPVPHSRLPVYTYHEGEETYNCRYFSVREGLDGLLPLHN